MKKNIIITVLFFALLLSLSAAAEAKDTFVVGIHADAKTLDPHVSNDSVSHNAMLQIYERLVTLDEKNDIVPQLAERWETPDPLTYKFYLKKGVKFHNGEELTAEDVLFSFKRAMGPEAGAIRAYADVIDPKGFEVADKYTIIMRTKEPMAAFLASMKHAYASIVNKKAVEEAGERYGNSPVGTGPFKFVEWRKGDRIVFERFDEYYGEKPKIKTMIFRAIPEATSRVIELETGNVDLIYYVPTSDVKRLESNQSVDLIRTKGSLVYYMGMNTEKKPFDDPRVRRAVDLAIDKEVIVDAVFEGFATVPAGAWSPAVKYAVMEDKPLAWDMEEAIKLLKEAGYPNGFKAELWIQDRKDRIDMATIIQAQLQEVGIDVEIKVLEWGAYLEKLKSGEHQMYILGWSASAPAYDPFFYVGPKFHSRFAGPSNRVRLKDVEVDRLIDAGAITPDGPERAKIYADLWMRLNELRPWVYLAIPDFFYGKVKGLQGMDHLSDRMVNYLGTAYFEK